MSEKRKREQVIKPRKMEKALTRAYSKTPEPSSLAALAEHYLRCEKYGKARKLIEEGLRKYPESQKIRALEQRIKRTDLYGEFLKTHRDITENPNPDAYSRLAMLYRRVGDVDKALGTCAAGLTEFADSVRLYLNVAELRLQRYARNFMPKDAIIALANLEKAVSLDETDYAATILLAEFYMAIGAAESAINTLKTLLVSQPEDEHAQQLLDKALEMPHSEEPVEDLLRDVSARKSMAVDTGLLRYFEKCTHASRSEPPRRNVDQDNMREALTLAVESTGARAMAILDPEGGVVATARTEDDPIETETFAVACKEIRDNTHDCALRMDLGGFETGEIEGPFGYMLVNSVEGWLIGGLTSARPSNRERMRKHLREVAEDCILTAPTVEKSEEPEAPDAHDAASDQGA